jgi:glycosyltransferase involved in cell wall biosynthesis
MPLVIVGGPGWLMENLPQTIAELNLTDDVILMGYVTDQELVWLYRSCYAHIYVSHFEGFGLPVLEGMQFGAPTIASKTTSIPEILDNAGILVDPLKLDQISAALLEVGVNFERRQMLVTHARKRAAEFSWEQSAQQMLKLYERVGTQPKRVTCSEKKQKHKTI